MDIKRKKSKILTKSEIDRFLSSADDKEFLMIKVGLILGIAGACRTDELVNLTVDDIEDVGSSLNFAASCQEYHGKKSSVVASYLKLPDVACYTGYCLRRSSATLLADAGVDITTIKRHAGWKSTTVAEGYVENSIENKTKIANQVLSIKKYASDYYYGINILIDPLAEGVTVAVVLILEINLTNFVDITRQNKTTILILKLYK
ncbi:hypothetical protein NQ317_012220 [Molorchus minor]|uniref:Tyr recombinase domain-containing protein n=1 Tax=Molorchus minor TaxID=1323400 RepID=A0ABQ9IVC5_9CUCU|nr:hypothetical protein NQ317_012220 [Molorchus minor]